MRTGRENQITKQLGEYLVVAELARRGLLATTFTGNVPHYDILATDRDGHAFAIQVKASNGGGWQFDIQRFVEVRQEGERQLLGSETKVPYPELICVFVFAGSKYGEDQFFILTWCDLQQVLVSEYRWYLDHHNGVRPKRHDSYHTVLRPNSIEKFRDNWDLICQRVEKEGAGTANS
ncbi:MAG: hypothetical protein WCB27_04425 [Thermoguttaceae bacterium]